MDWSQLIEQMKSGSIPALSRLISHVENRSPGWRSAMTHIYHHSGSAVTIGITGYPGSGKSTLVGQLVRELLHRGNRVGVIAIDPASHLSGGAFLGDRVRMNELSSLDDVYIRSMSSRGAMGGIHPAARDVIKILDTFGKDFILVETVGVGQDEIDVAKATQVVLLVCAPGQGDAIQYLKAGVMEIADIYVANKSDLPEAEQMVHHLRSVILQADTENQAALSIVKTSAVQGVGIARLVDEVEKRIHAPRQRDAWRRQQAIEDVTCLLKERIAELASLHWINESELSGVIDALLSGRSDPYSIADEMLIRNIEEMLKENSA